MIPWIMFGVVTMTQVSIPPSPPIDDDIVVVGQRLKNLRIRIKKDRKTGIKRCGIHPTSGDSTFDAGICDIYLTCVPKVETSAALEACMTPTLTRLAKDWADRRQNNAQQVR